MDRIAIAVTHLTEVSDPEEQLRRLRRANPYFSEIFRLQQANETLRLEVKRLTQRLAANGLLDAKELEEISGLIDDSVLQFDFVEDDDGEPKEQTEVLSPELLELQRAAEGWPDGKQESLAESPNQASADDPVSTPTDSQLDGRTIVLRRRPHHPLN
jgi:hypothetical protein